jgi:hypothetical protein
MLNSNLKSDIQTNAIKKTFKTKQKTVGPSLTECLQNLVNVF